MFTNVCIPVSKKYHVMEMRFCVCSCLALNDLLRGRPLDDIIDKLPEIWEVMFRVQDDIKVMEL